MQEDVLHDEEVEPLDRLAGVRQIRFGQQRVLADDVHAADAALEDRFDHVGGAQTFFCRQRRAPGRAEAGEHIGDKALIAGQRVGDAAGVARALHVVLPAQRGDAVADAPDLAG